MLEHLEQFIASGTIFGLWHKFSTLEHLEQSFGLLNKYLPFEQADVPLVKS
jgi:hypothetical protein